MYDLHCIMKHTCSILLCAAVACLTCAPAENAPKTTMNTQINYTEVSDYQAIRETIGLYLKGCSTGKSEDMKPAFLPEATMYWVENGELKGGPIQILFDGIDAMPGAGDQAAVVSSIVIEKNIAQARVETDKEGGPRYSDMFQLLKTKDGWKIISKIYCSQR